MYRRYARFFSFKSDNARNKKAQNAPSDQPAGQFAEPLRQGAYFQQGVVTGEIQQVVITNVHAGFAGFGDQLQQTAELPVEDGIACRGPPPRSTDASISAAERRRDTMKTTLDGVVFLLPHVSGHAKTEFHRRRIFPEPSEERGNGMRRPGESCRSRTVRRQNAGGKTGGRLQGRGGKTARQDGGRQGGAARRQAAGRQAAGRKRQDGGGKVAGRSGRTGRQDGAAGRGGRKRGGGQSRVIAADRSGGAARTNKKRARPSVPPVLAPGFQPPGAAGQRKSARRSGPASAKGQRTGSQYAVRTPGRVQYYPHGRR